MQRERERERRTGHDGPSSCFSLFMQTHLKMNNSYTRFKCTLLVLYHILLRPIKSKGKVKQREAQKRSEKELVKYRGKLYCWYRVVGVATGYGLDDLGIESRWVRQDF